MNSDSLEFIQEEKYLKRTLDFIHKRLTHEYEDIKDKEDKLISYRREMYENSSHSNQDFNKLSDTVQYLNPLIMQTMDYQASQSRVALFERMEKSPYFARVDFVTEKWGKESIYIGIGNLEDEDTFESYIYDWRAPISSIFYRYEIGEASYSAPVGDISGNITLKRQFEIEDAKLKFFFDSSVNILDDILKQTLSKNTSPQMKTIVETIQREQDVIIRDMESDLLIVQGVAGSGKTSVALHRIAYLMYEGLANPLSPSNMVLISPNNLFAKYISGVLPELGESNIQTVTFEKLFYNNYGEDIDFIRRNEVLDQVLTANPDTRRLLQDNIKFKSSPEFLEILHRLIYHYEHHMIPFTDIMYGGQTIFKRDLLKNRFLSSNSRSLPAQVRLQHIETIISDKLLALRPERLKKLEDYYSGIPELSLDFKTVARLMNTKQTSQVMKQVRIFTRIDYLNLYTTLFNDSQLFRNLSAGLDLPENIKDIYNLTRNQLNNDKLDYSDAMILLLLKLKMDSTPENIDIRQVVVDEAQDYSSVHYEILAKLFPRAKYTVLGDVNQTIVEIDNDNIYNDIIRLLNKRNTRKVSLSKSFRCSYEISSFASQFTDKDIEIQQLDRHSSPPEIIKGETQEDLYTSVVETLNNWKEQGYESLAVVCKNSRQADEVYRNLYGKLDNLKLFVGNESASLTGNLVIPIYLAKGLEFDGVIIFNSNEENYYTTDDRRLLYIGSTRALHKLALCYTGDISPYIKLK